MNINQLINYVQNIISLSIKPFYWLLQMFKRNNLELFSWFKPWFIFQLWKIWLRYSSIFYSYCCHLYEKKQIINKNIVFKISERTRRNHLSFLSALIKKHARYHFNLQIYLSSFQLKMSIFNVKISMMM
jgi:hypothetical protein